VLRSVRELEQFRVKTADGQPCGRIKDVYFDDLTWKVTHLVLSIEPTAFGRNEVLLHPAEVAELNPEARVIRLRSAAGDLDRLPLASSVPPVCKQYEAFVFTSPGARKYGARREANPHLRSARAVLRFRLDAGSAFSGTLADFLYESEGWVIRYLAVEQKFERKALSFYILPQAVKQITWATEKVVLRELKPVAVDLGEARTAVASAAAA
jgi:hypothetical protein